jgi:hypothetical protein
MLVNGTAVAAFETARATPARRPGAPVQVDLAAALARVDIATIEG